MERSVMLSSSSFHYTPEVVDLEAMNITEMFPEASSFSFDMSSSYNHSYSDSISGVPLAQQALWDDGQLSLSATVNSSRVFAHSSALSSLNNSANNSINHGQPSSRHLLVPPSHHGHHPNPHHHHHLHPQQQQYHYQGSPLKGDDGHMGHEGEQDQSHYDEYDESSLQHGWIDETRDQNGILLLNDKEHQDEQHLMFLQDIGATANLSRGDSISLFAKLADESDLSCDLFKEEIDADETRDQSKLQFEYGSSKPGLRVNTGDGNAIFDQEFLASLRTPLFPQAPPPLESATKRSFFEGLHTISAQSAVDDNVDIPNKNSQHSRTEGSTASQGKNEVYQQALKSFFDSLKIADPIKTPHKFAPQPLPILWNEPKIRSKALPSFDLADYKAQAQSTTTTPSIRTISKSTFSNPTMHTASATVAKTLQDKLGSLSSSPTNTHSVHTSARSSPMSSLSTTPPTGINTGALTITSTLTTPRAPTGRASPSDSDHYLVDNGSDSHQPKVDLSPTSARERAKRRPTINNPHLAFDPTIPPTEKAADDMQAESRSAKGTMERRSTLQQPFRNQANSKEQDDNGLETLMDPRPSPGLGERQGSVSGMPSATMPSGLKGPVIRKRRSLHQEMFQQNQAAGVEGNPVTEQQDEPTKDNEEEGQQPSTGRKGPRPLSVNILPESLTSLNNHALHQESTNMERARRLSEEEGAVNGAPASKVPGTLSLGRAAGTRYGRSGSNASGGSTASQMSPTTPTIANPYGTLAGRTPVRQSSQRLSMSGLSGMYTRPQSQQQQHYADEAPSPSKMQAPSSARSRNGSRSSPPPTLQGLRRPGHVTTAYESQFQKDSPQPTSATDYNDDYNRLEREQYPLQSPSRLNYSRQQQDVMERATTDPEWNEYDYEETSPRRTLALPQQVKTREPALTRRRSSAEQQREQHQLQRLRIQQQAREEIYGRGYGNGYADVDQDPVLDDYSGQFSQRFNQPFEQQQQHQKRNSLHSPPRDYMSATTSPVTPTSVTARGLAAAVALRSSPTKSPVTQQSSSRYSDHHRRQSRDGHMLMAAPRISPPLTAAPTGHARMSSGNYSNGGVGLTPRRSVSNVGGSLGISATSRRLSTATNVGVSSPTTSGYESALLSSTSAYNHGRGNNTGGGTGTLHGRSVSSGSGYGDANSTTTSPRSSMYSASSGGAGGGGLVRSATSIITDGGASNLHPPLRRAASTMIATPTSRRTSGTFATTAGHSSTSGTGAGGYRASTLGHSASTASSEYARVFVPPRAATGGSGGYGGNSNRNSHVDDYHHQDTYSNYRPDVPARQSSLSNGVGSRSSLATPRSSGGNALLGAPLSSSTSSSHLRRASSMSVTGNVNGSGGHGGLGSASLGRSGGSGVLSARQLPSSTGQQPQRYQRTSTYAYRS
ncbi:hypothetical protein BGZ72_004914 [Mortierella alpina]|nr:hypothetical protein BGZ72_004914 [Mortierella alpina]